MKQSLQRFEALAQRLVEGSLVRLFGGRIDPLEISAELARAIDNNQHSGMMPTTFVVEMHPDDLADLNARWPDAALTLAEHARQIAREMQLELVAEPHVTLAAAAALGRRTVRVTAAHDQSLDESTRVFDASARRDVRDDLAEMDAFLIVNGRRHVALDKPILTLGRHSECDIVIVNRRVSRRHAQIRWRLGRFIIYDLGSRAGTLVNDQPVSEFALRPGDVIALAGSRIIYGEGLSEDRAVDTAQQQTQLHPRYKSE